MPMINAPAISAALTANGDGTGYLTVASTTGFFAGAYGWVGDTAGTTPVRIIITEIKSATQLGARVVANDLSTQVPQQLYGGRSSFSAFLTANSARVYMENQPVRVENSYTVPTKQNV